MKELLMGLLSTVWGYYKADWWILLFGILVAVSIKVYVSVDTMRDFFTKKNKTSIFGSVGFGALTPLCACGTMAVLLSMFASALPWGPVMAFLVSSPLTSPSEFLFETSFLGSHFAIAMVIASIVLGLTAGFVAHLLDVKFGYFNNQFRFDSGAENCCDAKAANAENCCTLSQKQDFINKLKISEFVKEFYEIGIKRILLLFTLFISIGYIVQLVVPQAWILALFGQTNSYSIPLGATIGLPLYVSGSAALPLLKSFLEAGAGNGAILAFLIAGKATGVPVIVGLSTIIKPKAVAFYVAFVYFGAIIAGYLYQLFLQFV